MSWKTQFGKPLVLLECVNLMDATSKNKFELDDDFKEKFSLEDLSERILSTLSNEKDFDNACKYGW